MKQFFSRAKVILMGEYAVMHGADSLCLPLATGQHLRIENHIDEQIDWKWSYEDQVLAHFYLNSKTLDVVKLKTGEPQWAIDLLKLIRLQNPGFLKDGGYSLKFVNDFPPQWGLGSSAATISSLSRMANVNPYMVNQKLMGGSGADIACTTAQSWFLYRSKLPNPQIWEIPISYNFMDYTYFVYTGRKQATAEHLKEVKDNMNAHHGVSWLHANNYTYRFLAASVLPEILKIIYDHELLIAGHIKKEPIGAEFSDFPGKVKSLGAWGGDFFMALSQQHPEHVKAYFNRKGYKTVFSWEEFVETEEF